MRNSSLPPLLSPPLCPPSFLHTHKHTPRSCSAQGAGARQETKVAKAPRAPTGHSWACRGLRLSLERVLAGSRLGRPTWRFARVPPDPPGVWGSQTLQRSSTPRVKEPAEAGGVPPTRLVGCRSRARSPRASVLVRGGPRPLAWVPVPRAPPRPLAAQSERRAPRGAAGARALAGGAARARPFGARERW